MNVQELGLSWLLTSVLLITRTLPTNQPFFFHWIGNGTVALPTDRYQTSTGPDTSCTGPASCNVSTSTQLSPFFCTVHTYTWISSSFMCMYLITDNLLIFCSTQFLKIFLYFFQSRQFKLTSTFCKFFKDLLQPLFNEIFKHIYICFHHFPLRIHHVVCLHTFLQRYCVAYSLITTDVSRISLKFIFP